MLLRAVWLTLPLTAGQAASDALDAWSDATRVTAIVLLWLAWGAGAVAVLAPRPETLTLIRAVAPVFVVLAAVAAATGDTDELAAAGAVVATLVAAVLASSDDFAIRAVNAVAYGDEERFPLRVPLGLFLGPLPLARALLAAAVVAGPLLVADGSYVLGALAVVAGAPIAVFAARALHVLSLRWFVLVPAGVVVVDPLALSDPALLTRAAVRTMRPVAADAPIPGGTADLRLGASAGTLLIELTDETDLSRSARGRRRVESVRASGVLIGVARRDAMLRVAARRRVRVEAV